MKSLNKIGLPIFQKKAHLLKAKFVKEFLPETTGFYEKLTKVDKIYAWHWEHGMRLIPPELQEETLAKTLWNDLMSPPTFRKPEESAYSHICVYYDLPKTFVVFEIARSNDLGRRLKEHLQK